MSEMRITEYTPMQTLIRLVAAGARGETVNDLRVDWKEVFPLAAEQHVQSLVACALLHSPELECPTELREYMLNAMRSESSANLIRRQRIMQLTAEMEAAGIGVKVLKGYAVAGCYAYPECRGSVDIDLLIDIKEEKHAVAFLQERGFRVDPRAATSHHAVCQHKKYGMVELHVELYAELVRDVWYQGMKMTDLLQEPSIQVRANEEIFKSLGHTDQLIFLTLHMVKHFILEGLTLRMMLDIGLYFAHYCQQINVKRYWGLLQQLHYDVLVGGVLRNLIQYGGFMQDDFPGVPVEEAEQIQMILSDLEQGGYMGMKEKEERLESGMEYNRQVILQRKTQWQYVIYMLERKIRTGASLVFLSAKQLKRKYPISNRLPSTIPVFWLLHIIMYPFVKIRSGVFRRDIHINDNSLKVVAQRRIEMFKSLGMF